MSKISNNISSKTSLSNINVGIIGGAGYTGGELIRLLINHPYTNITFIHSRSNQGKPITSIHQDLIGETDLTFTGSIDLKKKDIDILFLCVGQGEAKKFLQENIVHSDIKIIDLSQDFRIRQANCFQEREFVYGLPELNKEIIGKASNIANPGCFATAIQLGLLPLAKRGLLKEVYTTGITGSTGAGQSISATSHFSWRANNIQPYKTLTHQHLHEIYQSLNELQKDFPELPSEVDNGINFIPWRGDFTRGIFITSVVTNSESLKDLNELYKDFYQNHPFTIVSDTDIFLKQVINTNKCIIHLQKHANKLVIHSAIDNLVKGAAGQALQNLNIIFGLDECTGLHLKPNAF